MLDPKEERKILEGLNDLSKNEVETRIEAARAAAKAEQDRLEFATSLTKNDTLLKNINNPQAFIMRDKASAAAARGEYPDSGCPHPVRLMNQFVDEDPGTHRSGRELNLFECGLCHALLWLVDPYGREAMDE